MESILPNRAYQEIQIDLGRGIQPQPPRASRTGWLRETRDDKLAIRIHRRGLYPLQPTMLPPGQFRLGRQVAGVILEEGQALPDLVDIHPKIFLLELIGYIAIIADGPEITRPETSHLLTSATGDTWSTRNAKHICAEENHRPPGKV